ncbi:MAG: M55 family metallopeptidase [Candidatus Bathyarchaeota archaeon]
MKVYISFDMEGVSGIAGGGMTGPTTKTPSAYPRGQRFATEDVKASIEGVLEVDPEAEIWFNDAHGKSMNVYSEEFPENVNIVVNSAELFDEVLGLDGSFDALICIGAHGHLIQEDAVLGHIWDVRSVEFNGKSLTETCLNAALAGHYGVPLVMISGDDDSLEYIRDNISYEIAVAPVKKGIGRYSAVSLHPKKAQRLIKETVIEGLKRRHEIPPLRFETPITVDITYKDQGGAFNNIFFMPGDERIAGDKVRFMASDAKEAYYGFLARDKLSKPK